MYLLCWRAGLTRAMEPTHPAAPACLCLLPAEGGISEMKYRFYVTRQGAPLRLWMMGTNLYSGGCEGGGPRFGGFGGPGAATGGGGARGGRGRCRPHSCRMRTHTCGATTLRRRMGTRDARGVAGTGWAGDEGTRAQVSTKAQRAAIMQKLWARSKVRTSRPLPLALPQHPLTASRSLPKSLPFPSMTRLLPYHAPGRACASDPV